MSDTVLNAAVMGVSGRLGRAIAKELMVGKSSRLSGGVVSSSSPNNGADIGELTGLGFRGLEAVVRIEDAIADADIVIDASHADVTATLAERLADRGDLGLVSGTTGLSEEQQARVEAAAQTIPILQASNFSLGVAIMERLVEMAARLLDPHEFDLEITEAHHRFKADSPSGTALSLGRAVARARDVAFDKQAVYQRPRQNAHREQGEIGFHAVRGGGVIGDHTLDFISDLEKISLQHVAFDRVIFAQGAIAAAHWLKDQPAGLYTMQDVISG